MWTGLKFMGKSTTIWDWLKRAMECELVMNEWNKEEIEAVCIPSEESTLRMFATNVSGIWGMEKKIGIREWFCRWILQFSMVIGIYLSCKECDENE